MLITGIAPHKADVPLILIANAGVVNATRQHAPEAWRRLLGYLLQSFAADSAQPLTAPQAIFRVLMRLSEPQRRSIAQQLNTTTLTRLCGDDAERIVQRGVHGEEVRDSDELHGPLGHRPVGDDREVDGVRVATRRRCGSRAESAPGK